MSDNQALSHQRLMGQWQSRPGRLSLPLSELLRRRSRWFECPASLRQARACGAAQSTESGTVDQQPLRRKWGMAMIVGRLPGRSAVGPAIVDQKSGLSAFGTL